MINACTCNMRAVLCGVGGVLGGDKNPDCRIRMPVIVLILVDQ